MINKKMEDALNKHMNAELYSWYLYLSMSGYFEDKNLQGCAHWMRLQAGEEMGHAMKFFKFLVDRGGRIKLDKIEKPKGEWKSALDVFNETLAHEKKVTAGIHNLVALAADMKDYATSNFLQWFVNEQVEEEATADLIIHKIKMAGTDDRGLFFIDRELASRAG